MTSPTPLTSSQQFLEGGKILLALVVSLAASILITYWLRFDAPVWSALI